MTKQLAQELSYGHSLSRAGARSPMRSPAPLRRATDEGTVAGTDGRENHQGLCKLCSDRKKAEKAARARGAKEPKRRLWVGDASPTE